MRPSLLYCMLSVVMGISIGNDYLLGLMATLLVLVLSLPPVMGISIGNGTCLGSGHYYLSYDISVGNGVCSGSWQFCLYTFCCSPYLGIILVFLWKKNSSGKMMP